MIYRSDNNRNTNPSAYMMGNEPNCNNYVDPNYNNRYYPNIDNNYNSPQQPEYYNDNCINQYQDNQFYNNEQYNGHYDNSPNYRNNQRIVSKKTYPNIFVEYLDKLKIFFVNTISNIKNFIINLKNMDKDELSYRITAFCNLRNPKFIVSIVVFITIITVIIGLLSNTSVSSNNISNNNSVNDLSAQEPYDTTQLADNSCELPISTKEPSQTASADESKSTSLNGEIADTNTNTNISSTTNQSNIAANLNQVSATATPQPTQSADKSLVQNANTSESKSEQTDSDAKDEEETPTDNSSQTSDSVDFSIIENMNWQSGDTITYACDITISNNSNNSLENWTATLTAPKGCTISEGWNAKVKSTSNKATLSPVDWNKNISTGSEITFTVCVSSPTKINVSDFSISLN